jgi:hypothetical protein
MTQVGFEPTIPLLERVKTVHALDGAVTVIGNGQITIKGKWPLQVQKACFWFPEIKSGRLPPPPSEPQMLLNAISTRRDI